MRFLHIADLHLGKQLNDLSLLADQEFVLEQIVSIAEEERADAVLIAGDVYQRSSPQEEAMALFDGFVSRLVKLGKKIFVISGNHDSALRISYFSSLIRSSGVYVSEAFEGRMQNVTLNDADGDIVVWLLPFLRPSRVKKHLPEERITTCQEAVQAVLRHADIDRRKRNVLICHQFITGSETSDSEEMTVGGLDNIDASVFDAFDYVALGHIHKPQKVFRDTLRYAGSPLKYSFSEAGHKKSAAIVDMREKGDVAVHTRPLYPLHDLRLLDGTLDSLMALPYSEDYLWITVHDELVPPDARVTLSVNFPNMMKFSVSNSRTKYDMDVLASQSMENKTVLELFTDFYRLQNNNVEPGEAHQKVLEKALRELEETT
ncbi:MAG: exonuclease SbcCD subunit D [Clostridia bacterium]|nr:exonuclease SbcCD subunit D [Clostridia bacterium]